MTTTGNGTWLVHRRRFLGRRSRRLTSTSLSTPHKNPSPHISYTFPTLSKPQLPPPFASALQSPFRHLQNSRLDLRLLGLDIHRLPYLADTRHHPASPGISATPSSTSPSQHPPPFHQKTVSPNPLQLERPSQWDFCTSLHSTHYTTGTEVVVERSALRLNGPRRRRPPTRFASGALRFGDASVYRFQGTFRLTVESATAVNMAARKRQGTGCPTLGR